MKLLLLNRTRDRDRQFKTSKEQFRNGKEQRNFLRRRYERLQLQEMRQPGIEENRLDNQM